MHGYIDFSATMLCPLRWTIILSIGKSKFMKTTERNLRAQVTHGLYQPVKIPSSLQKEPATFERAIFTCFLRQSSNRS